MVLIDSVLTNFAFNYFLGNGTYSNNQIFYRIKHLPLFFKGTIYG